jgi:biotin carboxyl carrier protein
MKKIEIIIDDTSYQTNSTPSYEKRKKWEKERETVVKSIIPGTIVDVFVNSGDKVKEGDRMLVIEAMKMNNQVYFHRDAVVKNVNVQRGSVVSKGEILLELE